MRPLLFIVAAAAAAVSPGASAFAPPSATTRPTTATPSSKVAAAVPLRLPSSPGHVGAGRQQRSAFGVEDGSLRAPANFNTALGMYNLPPSGGGGGGGGGPLEGLKQILPGVLTILGIIAFFASPLGSVFFFVTNSLLAVAFLSPLVLLVGFQAWQFFNTREGPCPSCGVPIRTLKDDGGNPTICFNCGSLVRTSLDGEGFELCNNPESMYAQDDGAFGGGLFGDLFGGGPGGGYYGDGDATTVTTTTTTTTTEEERKDKTRRQRTVIDVDVEVD